MSINLALANKMDVGVQERHQQAQTEIQQQLALNSNDIVASLSNGLLTLRELLLTRLHNDVEAAFGVDSLLAPVTSEEAQREIHLATEEIEIYSLVVVLAEVAHSNYANGQTDWFRDWLLRLRFAPEFQAAVRRRMEFYEPNGDNQRRHMFASIIEQALPEATKAPLIIYRLYARSVRIATALAFGDALRAREVRSEQIAYLPIIADCHECHGLPLDNGNVCPHCGNPLWKIHWLNATA